MPLRLTIMPFETIYINGAIIVNGSSKADIVLKNQCRMLRGSEMISEEEARTPCKRIVYLLQQIHLKEDHSEELRELSSCILELLVHLPGSNKYINNIQNSLDEKKTHAALKHGKALATYEAQVS
ncbi:flagellar biosynthesis repressor FlbT [Methylobacterium currus]|nr:flagellar biosynthesis repressor FlbT [Methylobacterium currus]